MQTTTQEQTRAGMTSRGRLRHALCALSAGLTLICGVALVHAESPPALAKFSGKYKYAGSKDQGIAIVDKALDEGLSDLNMVMRFMIKKAMEDHFFDVIVIDVKGSQIGIKTGELPNVTTEDGKTENVKSPDGKYTIKVTHRFDGSRLIEVSSGDEGTTTTVYSLSSDGKTLQRSVTFKSDRLSKAIRYKLAYKRK